MENTTNAGQDKDKMQQDNTSSPDTPDNEVEALSNNKVDVEIEPDVKANRVNIQICSCSLMFNCFSPNRPFRKIQDE